MPCQELHGRNKCFVFASCVASGRLRTDGVLEENVTLSLQTKRAIYLTKTPFQLHDILSYAGSKINFIRQAPTGDWNIFMVTRWKMWSPNSVKNFFLHGKTQKRKVFKTIFCMKIFLLRNDRKNQILCLKALKCHVVEIRQIDSSLGLET